MSKFTMRLSAGDMEIGDKCWFTKSMRMVEIVEVHSDGYTVETVDVRKRLFATEKGLELIRCDEPPKELPK